MAAVSDNNSRSPHFWSSEETTLLLKLMKEYNILKCLDGRKQRNGDVFRKVWEGLSEAGFNRSVEQIRNRWKMLKQAYRRVKKHNSEPAKLQCFYLLDELLGNRPVPSAGSLGVGIGFEAIEVNGECSSPASSSTETSDLQESRDESEKPPTLLSEPVCKPPPSQRYIRGKKRKRVSLETLQHQEFLERLQQRHHEWLAEREERLISIMESLAATSERVANAMVEGFRIHNQLCGTNSTVVPVIASVKSEAGDQSEA